MFKRFLKIIALVYIYQLTKFDDLTSCDSKDIFKNVPCLMLYTHHDVKDQVNHGIVKDTKTWISWERNITFLRNKKKFNLYLTWHFCTNTGHDVKNLVNHDMVNNTKTWISWERNITFQQNKKILNMCLTWHNLRSYHSVAEVPLKAFRIISGKMQISLLILLSWWYFSCLHIQIIFFTFIWP